MNGYQIIQTIRKYSPEILTGVSCVGVGLTGILASKATIDALPAYEAFCQSDRPEYAKTKKEKFQRNLRMVRACGKPYIPALVSGIGTIAAITGLHHTMQVRSAALTISCIAANTAYQNLRETVVDELGEKKGAPLILKSTKKTMNPVPNEDDIPALPESGEETGLEKALVYDSFSGRYFISSIEHLKRIETDLNADLVKFGWVSMNQIYEAMDLEPIRLGEDLGFSFDADDISTRINFQFDADITDEGRPYIILGIDAKPKWTYYYATDRAL